MQAPRAARERNALRPPESAKIEAELEALAAETVALNREMARRGGPVYADGPMPPEETRPRSSDGSRRHGDAVEHAGILVCFYDAVAVRACRTHRDGQRAAVAASRTENLRLALSPASKVCVDATPSPRVRTLTPLLRDSVDIAVESCAPYTRPVSQSRLPQRIQIAAFITLFRDRKKSGTSQALTALFTRSRQVCSS